MKKLFFFILAVFFLVTGPQVVAKAMTCSNLYPKVDRTAYIDETSRQSRYKAVAQTIFTGSTILQLGTPTMLRGLKMKGFFWTRDGHLLRGMKRAYGSGISPWGKIEIFTQSGKANTLMVTINPLAGYKNLSEKYIELLLELFPSLKVEIIGDSGMLIDLKGNEMVPNEILLSLDRSQLPSENSFEKESRSLVTTLLNDPKGMLTK